MSGIARLKAAKSRPPMSAGAGTSKADPSVQTPSPNALKPLGRASWQVPVGSPPLPVAPPPPAVAVLVAAGAAGAAEEAGAAGEGAAPAAWAGRFHRAMVGPIP